jgi:unspecific monooxygenase
MQTLLQSPTDPGFVQNPYPFYAQARALGPVHLWADYAMPTAFSYKAVHALLRDRRFGREIPTELRRPGLDHLAPFQTIEAHSMLDAEPPRHTRLRGLVLRAFTSRRIAALEPDITALCHQLIDQFPAGPVDLIPSYCTQVPALIIARLLGVPDAKVPDLLNWSHAMVAMYQANRTPTIERAAARAATDFSTFLRVYIEQRRSDPTDDLISHLIAAQSDGDRLSMDELIGTCVLLLNAGHEATVHTLGNAVKTLLDHRTDATLLDRNHIAATTEELLRYDPPLHMFTRYAYEPVTVFGHSFQRGDQVALLLGAANRDPDVWANPDRFDPSRAAKTNASFGGGLHFCVGAPLARLELQIGLQILFQRCPTLRLAAPPTYADSYHFHGLTQLMVHP